MKKIFTILMICILLFMVGCGKKDATPTATKPFIGGKVGLNMEFIEGVPPDEVYDQGSSSFAIGLKLENIGEYNLEANKGYVEIIGINPKDFNLKSQADLKKNIESGIRAAKKSVDGSIIDGDTIFVEFGGMKYLPDLKGNTEFKFRANLCYDYVTQSSTKICVDKNPLASLDAPICKVTGDKDPQNSGGPIQITKLKESPLGNNKVQLLFDVEHVGASNNMFYREGTECLDTLTNMDKYKVKVKVTSDVDGVKPKCSGLEAATGDGSEGFVTLFNSKRRSVTCVLDLAHVDSVFEELFTVELGYRYHQYVEKKIEVQDVSVS